MLENIKLFATDNNRLSYEEGDNYTEPYVSLVDGDNSVFYNKSNRGDDTPVQILGFKFDAGAYGLKIAGTYGYNENFIVAQIYRNGDNAMLFDTNGNTLTSSRPLEDTFVQNLCDAITNTLGELCETYILIDSPVSYPNAIENWNMYQLVSQNL